MDLPNRIYGHYEEEYGIKGKEYDSVDYFRGVINIAIDKRGVSLLEIADEFKVSESTCERWMRGKSFPKKSIRKIVLDRLADLVVDKQKRIK